jgi:hypothetical protein
MLYAPGVRAQNRGSVKLDPLQGAYSAVLTSPTTKEEGTLAKSSPAHGSLEWTGGALERHWRTSGPSLPQ